MPSLHFTIEDDGSRVALGISAPAIYQTRGSRVDTWIGLIDTGATMSVVSPEVVDALNLPELGVELLSSAGGSWRECPTFEAQFRLGGHHRTDISWTAVTVFGVQPAAPDVAAILGMDILLRCTMTWNGRKRVGSLTLR